MILYSRISLIGTTPCQVGISGDGGTVAMILPEIVGKFSIIKKNGPEISINEVETGHDSHLPIGRKSIPTLSYSGDRIAIPYFVGNGENKHGRFEAYLTTVYNFTHPEMTSLTLPYVGSMATISDNGETVAILNSELRKITLISTDKRSAEVMIPIDFELSHRYSLTFVDEDSSLVLISGSSDSPLAISYSVKERFWTAITDLPNRLEWIEFGEIIRSHNGRVEVHNEYLCKPVKPEAQLVFRQIIQLVG